MPKIEPLSDLANLTNEQSAVGTINSNNDKVEAALQNTLSRDGSTPNAMESDLDMNSKRILNISAPGGPLEPLRLQDFVELGGLTPVVAAAVSCSPSGSLSATNVQAAIEELNNEKQPLDADLTALANGFLQSGTGAVTRTWQDKVRGIVAVEDFGVVSDVNQATRTVNISSGTGALEVVGASFTANDVGKIIQVTGAGTAGAPYFGTITTFTDATHVTVSPNAGTTLASSSQVVTYGTNNATAIQNCVNFAAANNRKVWLSSGNYAIGAQITSPSTSSRIFIEGEGRQNSVIYLLSATNALNFVTNLPVTLRSFGVFGSQTQGTAGTLVTIAGSGNQNFGSVIDDMYLSGGNQVLFADPCALFSIINSFLGNAINNGIILGNSFLPLSGGYLIANCNIGLTQTASVRQTGVQLRSGGNLHITNSLIHFCNTAVHVNPNQTVVVGNIFITGCSIEQNDSNGIVINKGSATLVQTIAITGCDFGGATPNSIILGDGNSAWLEDVTVTGNVLYVAGGVGINISDSTSGANGRVIVGNNVIREESGTTTGIAVSANANAVDILNNSLQGLNTPINNASASTIIVRNRGYNPVGASILSPGASPWTYTAGASPETIYISASTSITNVTQGGVGIVPNGTAANEIFTVELGPREAVIITYTGTLNGRKMVH